MPVTISNELAAKAVAALTQTGDHAAARELQAWATPLYVLRGRNERGRSEFLCVDADTFGGPATARLFVEADRDTFDIATVDGRSEDVRFEDAVSADDIAVMHDTTDPDIVDEYVVLMERADRLRGELATA